MYDPCISCMSHTYRLLTEGECRSVNKRRIAIDKAQKEIVYPMSEFRGQSPDGSTLGVNSKYFIKNGKPWYPVMGEFHFSRYPHAFWEESILNWKSSIREEDILYLFQVYPPYTVKNHSI